MKKTSFIYGTVLLALVNFLIRILGFAYRIILSRIIGAEGMGIVQLVSPLTMFLLTVVASGIPIAVSKLVSEHDAKNNQHGVTSTLRISFGIVILLSIILSGMVLIGGKYISYNILKDDRTYYALIAFVPCIIIVGLSSILRGYYFGVKLVGVTAKAQMIEQLIRIPFVVVLLYLLFPMDFKYAAVIIVIGMVIGELWELIWLIIKFPATRPRGCKKQSSFKLNILSLKSIVSIALPITFSRVVSTLIQTANSILIPQRLQLAGYTKSQAIVTYGKLTGMALPLLFLPFIVTSALAANVIPNIAEYNTKKDWYTVNQRISTAIKFTAIVALPTTIIFLTFPYQLGSIIYDQGDVGFYLLALSFAPIFLSLSHTVSGILQGLGRQMITTRNDLIGMSLQLFFTFFLVPKPHIGILGYIIGFIASNSLILVLDFIHLVRIPSIKIMAFKNLFMPGICSIIMYVIINNIYPLLLASSFSVTSSVLISILGSILAYILTLLVTGTLSIKQIKVWFS